MQVKPKSLYLKLEINLLKPLSISTFASVVKKLKHLVKLDIWVLYFKTVCTGTHI